jgi:hypothetical protein
MHGPTFTCRSVYFLMQLLRKLYHSTSLRARMSGMFAPMSTNSWTINNQTNCSNLQSWGSSDWGPAATWGLRRSIKEEEEGPSDWWSGAYFKGLTLPKDLRQRGSFGGPHKKKKQSWGLSSISVTVRNNIYKSITLHMYNQAKFFRQEVIVVVKLHSYIPGTFLQI